MATIIPTIDKFIYWFNQYKSKKCTKEYARQQVCFHQTQWYYLCRDYENGEDISKYFRR